VRPESAEKSLSISQPEVTERVLTVLSAAYPNFAVRPETVQVYARLLGDLDGGVLERAALICISRYRFFPTVSELREVALSVSAPPPRSGVEAWGDVLREVRRVGYNGEPQFDDPAIAAVIEGFGWRNLCLDEEPMVLRAHFLRAYEQCSRRIEEQRRLPQAIR